MIDFLFILLTSSLAGSVMILVVKIIDFFLRKHGARLQYLLMRMTLFMYFLSTIAIIVTTYKRNVLYIQDGENVDFPYVEHVTGWGFKEVFGTDSYRYFGIVLLIWVIGFVIMEVEDIVREKMILKNILKDSTIYDEGNFSEQKQNILKEMKIKKDVTVFQSLAVDMPFTAGLFKPVVVLPKQEFSEDALTIILKHEFTHLKRKETFYKFVMGFVRGVNWFNPLMILFTREFYNYSELTCDEIVMENEGKEIRFRYSQILLAIAGGTLDSEIIAALASNSERTMERRIINIMSGDRKVGRMVTAMVSLVFLLVCFGVISVSANSTEALKNWIIEEKIIQNGEEEKVGIFIFPEGAGQFEEMPYVTVDDIGSRIDFPYRGANLTEVEVEEETIFKLTNTEVGMHIRFNVFSKAYLDKFQAGILNLNTGEYQYVPSLWGGVTHTFYITKPGKYVAFIKNENSNKNVIRLFGNIYTTYR